MKSVRMDYYGLPVPRLVCIQGEATEDCHKWVVEQELAS